MSEETAKLLIATMNKLIEALAKPTNQSQTVIHYHYEQAQPTYVPYYNPPLNPPFYQPVWVSNGSNPTITYTGSVTQ